jgi:hypothetical protein
MGLAKKLAEKGTQMGGGGTPARRLQRLQVHPAGFPVLRGA